MLAEKCFIAALGDCMSANSVFSEWAHTWARRAIVKNALRIVNNCALYETGSETDRGLCRKIPDAAEFRRPEFGAILALPAFDRFAFVLSVLERFSAGEVSSLLGRPIKEVHEARIRALQKVVSPARRERDAAADLRASKVRFSMRSSEMAIQMQSIRETNVATR
jgi:DNA-directed RNA polymerase specialized sigma24 family protein